MRLLSPLRVEGLMPSLSGPLIVRLHPMSSTTYALEPHDQRTARSITHYDHARYVFYNSATLPHPLFPCYMEHADPATKSMLPARIRPMLEPMGTS